MFPCKKEKPLLRQTNAESAPCLSTEDGSTDLSREQPWRRKKKNWTPNYLSNPFMKLTLFYKSGLQAVMWAYKDACTGLIYNTDWQGERDLPRNKTQDNKKRFYLPYIHIFIYFMNWLIDIQGQRRAGSLSQHALSERQGNILDRAPVYHRALKDTDKQYHT